LYQTGMTSFITQGMVANKLTTTCFVQIILLFRYLFAVFFYFCALAIGTMESYCYFHFAKILLFSLIAKFLYQHAFYITTQECFYFRFMCIQMPGCCV
jgi:hypothetical protein